MPRLITRRSAIAKAASAAVVAGAAGIPRALPAKLASSDAAAASALKGRINQSACRWCYDKIPLDAFCEAAKAMGLKAIDLLTVDDFSTLKKHGLTCSMVEGVPGKITNGLNRTENHERIAAYFERTIPKVAEAGFPNMICFSGNARGMDRAEGLENCAKGLQPVIKLAEKYKVTLCMELLNSRVNHKDYMCDHTAWGVELCRKVGSENFKLLYDIYHMQIMEGDIIRTIRDNHEYFGHYHTGGVPDRHEIDETQELCYPAIMRAIAESGFKGYVAQEFVPKRADALESLKRAIAICDV